MANINLIEKPKTVNTDYYKSGNLIGNVNLSLDYVDNPILFTFNSEPTNILSNPSQLSLIVFAGINYDILDGDTFTIFNETFTARTNPDSNSEFFAETSNASNAPIIAQSISDAINSNVNLSWRFFASVIDLGGIVTVQLFSKFTGTIFDLNAAGNVTSNITNNPTFINNGVTVANNNRGEALQEFDYGCWVEISKNYFEEPYGRIDNVFVDVNLQTLSQRWNSSNHFTFDVSQYLKSELELFTPDLNVFYFNFTNVPKQIIDYRLVYGEEFKGGYNFTTGEPDDASNNYLRKYRIDETERRWATHGVFDLNNNPSGSVNYWNSFENDNRIEIDFLNTEPDSVLRKRVENTTLQRGLVSTPWYLYILLYNPEKYNEDKQYRMMFENTFLDGTSSNFTSNDTITNQSNIHVVAIGDIFFKNLESSNQQLLKTDYYVEVFTNGEWVKYSKTKTWNWDLNNEEQEKYTRIYWRNRLGQISQFDFEGQTIKSLDVDSENYETTLRRKNGNFKSDGQIQILKNNVTEEITVNSGFLDEDHFNWLQEMLESTDVYVIGKVLDTVTISGETKTNEIDTLVKINIEDSDWNFDSENKLYNLELTYVESTNKNTRTK